jgi:hypothetical protein
MAVGRETQDRTAGPVYRGQHGGADVPWPQLGTRTGVAVIVGVAVALALIVTASLLPSSRSDKPRLLPPVPARLSQPPLVPLPPPLPSGPPGFPSAIPTADPPSPTPPPSPTRPPTTRPAPPPPKPPVPPSLAPVSFEAESSANTLRGEASIRAARRASGGQVIEYIGGGSANSLRFNRLAVPADGVYAVVIHYISAGDRNATLRINNGRSVSVKFPATNDWETVRSLTVRIRLDKGLNSIEFSNSVDYAPDLDRIVLSS